MRAQELDTPLEGGPLFMCVRRSKRPHFWSTSHVRAQRLDPPWDENLLVPSLVSALHARAQELDSPPWREEFYFSPVSASRLTRPPPRWDCQYHSLLWWRRPTSLISCLQEIRSAAKCWLLTYGPQELSQYHSLLWWRGPMSPSLACRGRVGGQGVQAAHA